MTGMKRAGEVLLFAAVFGVAGAPPRARACGGLFCSSPATVVNQTAEQILFVDHSDNTITAVIQIMYDGPSDKFAWVLPVPGTPKIAISSDSAFTLLRRATDPSYQLRRNQPTCDGKGSRTSFSGFADGGVGRGGPVTVRASGAIGPYDYRVIELDPALPDAAQVGLDWLTDNGYDVGDLGPDVLRPYLQDRLNLLAFKLTKDGEAGSIRPVMITYEGELASIPIRPTAVAANDDMGVLVWVLGDSRAVPQNYKALELNETLINWFNPMSNYDEVVTRAADEAQGQGFVTEYAGPHAGLPLGIFTSDDRKLWDDFRRGQTEQDGTAIWVQDAIRNWGDWQGFDEAFAGALTALPRQVSAGDVKADPARFLTDPPRADVGFERQRFVDQLAQWVIDPLAETQRLFEERPYLTRLYTTLSPAEMTTDPNFVFNPDLGTISNVHTADMMLGCESPNYRVQLPDGKTINGDGQTPWPLTMDGAPAALRIMEYGTRGEGRVLEDRTAEVDLLLARHNRSVQGPGDEGCAVSAIAASRPRLSALWIVAAAALTARRRRQRHAASESSDD